MQQHSKLVPQGLFPAKKEQRLHTKISKSDGNSLTPETLLTQLLHARLRLIVNSHSWSAAHPTVHPPDLIPMMYSRNEDALE